MGCGPSKSERVNAQTKDKAAEPAVEVTYEARAAAYAAARAEEKRAREAEGGGGGKEPSAAELNIMLALLETVKIKDGKVNQAAESFSKVDFINLI